MALQRVPWEEAGGPSSELAGRLGDAPKSQGWMATWIRRFILL